MNQQQKRERTEFGPQQLEPPQRNEQWSGWGLWTADEAVVKTAGHPITVWQVMSSEKRRDVTVYWAPGPRVCGQ